MFGRLDATGLSESTLTHWRETVSPKLGHKAKSERSYFPPMESVECGLTHCRRLTNGVQVSLTLNDGGETTTATSG